MTDQQVIPYLTYQDAAAASEWLAKAFGFEEVNRVASPEHERMTASLRRIVTELDLELAQAREELGGTSNVAPLPPSRRRRQ
ncbi:VOC family protein [Nonomuraea fuscirosea]|uniref:VOC family protein n=1 Tax=Nonomuraea fuscirosea TaxID=1291556 RepID=UPI00341EC6E4